MPDHLTVASCSTENMAIWNSCNIDISQSFSSCDMFRWRKFENRAWIHCRLGPILSRPTIRFEVHAKMAKDIDQRAIFGSLKAPWPSPWIGSRSHQHAQYMYNYQLIWPCDCSLTQYRNMAIWISWNIDIPRSLNSCDSFHRRKFKNRATKSCRADPNYITINHQFWATRENGRRDRLRKVQFPELQTFDQVEVILVCISGQGLHTHTPN